MNVDIGGISTESAPAINNACLPNIYDKLDADAREKVRVMNRMLTHRLKVQEKIIEKYKTESLKYHIKEKERIKVDLKRIVKKSPSVTDLTKLDFLAQYRNGHSSKAPEVKYKGYATEPIEMKGLQTEKESRPFCDRFYTHHIPTVKHNKFMTHAPSLNSLPDVEENSRVSKLLLSRKMSASDNFLSGKRKLNEDQDALSTAYNLNRTLLLNKTPAVKEDDVMTI